MTAPDQYGTPDADARRPNETFYFARIRPEDGRVMGAQRHHVRARCESENLVELTEDQFEEHKAGAGSHAFFLRDGVMTSVKQDPTLEQKRAEAYPAAGAQLGALYDGIARLAETMPDVAEAFSAFIELNEAVKAAHPKPQED